MKSTLTPEQKSLIEKEAGIYWNVRSGIPTIDFQNGMTEVLTNPEKYGLYSKDDMVNAVNETAITASYHCDNSLRILKLNT